MTGVSVVRESSTNIVVGLNLRGMMKRINLTFPVNVQLAEGINEIMDHLETHNGKNGVIFTCVNCKHATAYPGDLGKCCNKPLYEV